MKKTVKCGMLAAVFVASVLAAYQSYGSYGAQDNSLLMQNIEALASNSDSDGDAGGDGVQTSALLWLNSHIVLSHYNKDLRIWIPTDSVKGESVGTLFISKEKIDDAIKKGYRYNSHIHGYMICEKDLSQII